MELVPARVEVVVAGAGGRDRVAHSALLRRGPIRVGPLEVDVEVGDEGGTSWSVANRADATVRVRAVAVVFDVVDAPGPLRMFRHGYQSWSHTGVAVFGVDRDPSRATGSLRMVRGVHHADADVTRPEELRSEWVTVLQSDGEPPELVGFDGGDRHDGTFRLRDGDAGSPELWAEAFLGGAALAPGEARRLHRVLRERGQEVGSAPELLESWASAVGASAGARVTAPYQVGWCSWYHYFHDVREADLRANLALADDWPFDVFQLDDGFQAAIGDWLQTNERFPSTVDELATAIVSEGRTPGLWIAPFLAAPNSEIATRHPDWLARTPDGEPLPGMFNPPWGGGRDGFMWALDTTHPEVAEHLERTARSLVDAGYRYLKLDFTFAPSFEGVWHDPAATPAQRVRRGYDAVRRGTGEDVFLLGCGVPLSNVVGVVDANRIGPDVAPSWDREADRDGLVGYEDTLPSTRQALHATCARSFQHRRLWLNDPDCLMLRSDETDLSEAAAATWERAVALSGGMALVSDDLALLDDRARRRLDEVVALGRESDAASRAGITPRCEDVLRHADACELSAVDRHLVVEPASGRSTLERD